MSLTVLSVAYPFAPVSPDPVGGAEAVLAAVDAALVAAGHRSLVIAQEGSRVAGVLLPVPAVRGEIDDAARERVHAVVRATISDVLARERVDAVHLHGIDFGAYLPPPGPPALVTLHLPLDWYPADALRPARPRTFLHPVSPSQARAALPGAALESPIENGVALPPRAPTKRCYAFALGRICPEKGFDDALDAARAVDAPLLLAGEAFPYAEHQAHLRNAILPRLDSRRRWLGAVAGARKRRLLAGARCLLVPSKAPETSSLVAMEALAAGTPVIAYRAGALPDIVEDGVTGYLVDGPAEMAAAIGRAGEIGSAACRAAAGARFSRKRMTDAYLARYAELAA